MKKEKIAVIGMGGLFPGSDSLDAFWQNLIENKDLVKASSTKEFGADPASFYHNEKGKLDKCYSVRGGYIRDFKFDSEGYQLSPEVLYAQDDQFKWSLYVAREALQHSGYWKHESLNKCGAIVGNLSFPTRYSRQMFSSLYTDMAEDMMQELGADTVKLRAANTDYPTDWNNTLLSNAPSALIAQATGLKGSHYSLDAACASSLYAVKLACDELHNGKADMMLAGAVSGADPLFIHMGFSYFHAYAREGELSAPLSEKSGGLTSAEGAGMVVLKRLSDAEKAGDNILAVIDATGLSNDGKGKFLLSPNPKGQKLAFERAYEDTELQPSEVDYLECHATGTPLGDTTEMDSISDFFAKEGHEAPLLGSVKSNMGHLLTAAGMTGMLKVIMAMRAQHIPATIKVATPLQTESGITERVVQQNRDWKAKGEKPHAGINAFGFGGTNAHMVLSAYEENQAPIQTEEIKPQPLSIVGMDMHFADCEGIDQFYITLFEGRQHFRPLPEERWKGMERLKKVKDTLQIKDASEVKGAWLEDFDLDLFRFKIQPKEAERLTLQQTLMLKVADKALKDANMGSWEGKAANVAVITAMESELEIHHRMGRWDLSWQVNQALEQAGLNVEDAEKAELGAVLKNAIFPAHPDHSPSEHTGFIGNIISCRISALWDFTGPAFTVSSNENAVFKGLEIARNLLSMGEVDAVVLGAIDMAGSMESVLSRHTQNPINTGGSSMSWDIHSNGWTPGEGAGAIVLKRAADATEDLVYAQIDDLALVQSNIQDAKGSVNAETVAKAAREILTKNKLKPADIGLLEVSASGNKLEDQAELEGLTQAYSTNGETLSCALGSVKSNIGHTFSASGMASIIKSALSLYYRFIPQVPQWNAPKQAERFEGTPFYVAPYSTPWIAEKGQDKLRAGISGLSSDGTVAHMLLSEANHPESSPYLLKGDIRLFPVQADSRAELSSALDQLLIDLEVNGFHDTSDTLCEAFSKNKNSEVIALVGNTAKGLEREIQFFKTATNKASDKAITLQSPGGSYYTSKPLGPDAGRVLVYPGSGSAYTGLGSGLSQTFPQLQDFVDARMNDLRDAFWPGKLYPRSMRKADAQAKKAQEAEFQTNALAMMAVGVAHSAMYTHLLQDILKVKADAALGYSMGETSTMWYSQGIWDGHLVDEKVMEAPLFREKVGGPMKLLSQEWNMPAEEAKKRWSSRLINIPNGIEGYDTLADWYKKVIAPQADKVYLTFVNTDSEIIISGDNEELTALEKKHQLSTFALTINNVVHHPFCAAVQKDLIQMHNLPIEKQSDLNFYSSITTAPLMLESQELASNATEVCCNAVDFPALIRGVAKDGHQLFIELGANANCSKWIKDILKDEKHACIAADRKGAGSLQNVYALVAQLMGQHVAVDISAFYEDSSTKKQKRPVLNKTLNTGGKPYYQHIDTDLKAKYQSYFEAQPALEMAEAALAEGSYATQAFTQQHSNNTISDSTNYSIHSDPTETMTEIKTEIKLAENGLALQDYSTGEHNAGKNIIWDEQDLHTFASGKISDVFGEEFNIVDTYSRRVMLPMPPYLLVSRVTELQAKTGEFKPSKITTEYDIPYDSWFATDGQIPWAVSVESGQCDLLLISYLGIDFQNKGEYVYRLLDCTLTFMDDLPFEGQTLRYDISINSFVRNGKNLLFFFSYDCYVEDRLVLKMRNGCAGFFSDEELSHGQGVVMSPKELEEKKNRTRQFFTPLLECNKSAFNRQDLEHLVAGDIDKCFGKDYAPFGKNKSLRLPPEGILMLDRITEVDRVGGSSGLGYIEAEKDLEADDWYFPCHFRDDEVLAGSLQAEGGGQLLRFYMMMLGMQRLTKDARFQPILDLPQKVRCRKEVPAKSGKLIYKMDVKEIGLTPTPYVVADLEIWYDGYMSVYFENLGLRLQEKDTPTYKKDPAHYVNGIYVKPAQKEVLLNEADITEFALGKIHRCFGDDYKVFEGRTLSRQPNTDLQLISRVLSISNERYDFKNNPQIISEYDVPADAWYFTQNAGNEIPYSILMEIALQPCGFMGAYLGSTLAFPDKDLYFRNLDGDGHYLQNIDLRGKTITNKSTMTSHTNLGGTVLQRYEFELYADGKLFYKGKSSFGFFTKEDLSSQAGLDQGKAAPTWLAENSVDADKALSFKLDSLFGKMKLYRSTEALSPELHLSTDQLNLLDQATVISQGGKYGKGYLHASREIKPSDWFFTCHFYQDSVMPGSLGIEAIFQAIQLYALQKELGKGLQGASFHHKADNQTVWKYRGQILQDDPLMHLEIHIKDVIRTEKGVEIIADANLWKGALRIYEVTDLGVAIF